MKSKKLVPSKELLFKINASPYFWRGKARELKHAADILWPHCEKWFNELTEGDFEKLDLKKLDPNIFSIYLSLIGFSTEALFKGIIIRDNPEFISNGSLSSHLTSHDLLKLAKTAKLVLSQNEKIFCKHAYKAMIIDSRYPIPKKATEPEGSIEIGGHCKEVFTSLYEKIYPTIGQFYNTKTTWREIT